MLTSTVPAAGGPDTDPVVADERLRDAGIDELAAGLNTRRELLAAGSLRLDHLWGDSFASALAADARRVAPRAAVPEFGPRTPVTAARSHLRRIPVAQGPLLLGLHDALSRLARTLTGRLLVPSFATYGYFEGDDECILHYDTDQSDLTLLIMALGQVAPLRVHPELEGSSEDELGALECDPRWDRRSGVPVPYSRTGLTAILGRRLPHHRPKGDITGLAAVAALHYRDAF